MSEVNVNVNANMDIRENVFCDDKIIHVFGNNTTLQTIQYSSHGKEMPLINSELLLLLLLYYKVHTWSKTFHRDSVSQGRDSFQTAVNRHKVFILEIFSKNSSKYNQSQPINLTY